MKQIIGILAICLAGNQLNAQTPGPSAGAKVLSTVESKKLNGNSETMINGIPYNQYKAQQDALKSKQQQQTAPSTAPKLQPVSATLSSAKAFSTSQNNAPVADNNTGNSTLISKTIAPATETVKPATAAAKVNLPKQ